MPAPHLGNFLLFSYIAFSSWSPQISIHSEVASFSLILISLMWEKRWQ